nr:MAG TPA: hypothetical protein [Ackermannviridae sp.]
MYILFFAKIQIIYHISKKLYYKIMLGIYI